MLCSVMETAERSRGRENSQSTSFLLYLFLRALEKKRVPSKLLYMLSMIWYRMVL